MRLTTNLGQGLAPNAPQGPPQDLSPEHPEEQATAPVPMQQSPLRAPVPSATRTANGLVHAQAAGGRELSAPLPRSDSAAGRLAAQASGAELAAGPGGGCTGGGCTAP